MSQPPGGQPSRGLPLARAYLHRVQASWARGIARPADLAPLAVARERMAQRVREAVTADGYIREGAFRYEAGVERARWARTEQIIERVQPGPFEDGGYLEFLARQAASVELVLAGGLVPGAGPVLDRVVFGTTGEPTSQASTTHVGDAAVITMSAGMVYLMYQLAKAVVLSWKQVPAGEGSAVAFSSRPEDTRAVLDADDTPSGLVEGMLLGWLFEGVARPPESAAPPPAYHPPLTLLINNAERFVIAHEYGHALIDQLAVDVPWMSTSADITAPQKELRADLFATVVAIRGAGDLDRMAPNMALQGAMLAMKAHEIADRAIDIARGGDGDPGWTSATHPPFQVRASLVADAYRGLLADPGEAGDPGDAGAGLGAEALYVAADTAEILWERVRPRLTAALRAGRRLHPLWASPPAT